MSKERWVVSELEKRYGVDITRRWLAKLANLQLMGDSMADDIDRLADLLDVLLTDPQDGDTLRYDAIASRWKNGNGGSSPSTWVGPYAITAADYNPALGSGWDGILVEDALPSGMLLLGVAFIVDVVFVNTSTVVIYAGTLAGNDYGTSPVSSGTNVYDGQPQRAGFSVGTQPAGAGVLLTGADVSQVWIDSFTAPPPSGSGRLWLNLVTADLPA